MSRKSYDMVVIGAGSGGMACAKKAARLGADVAVVENRTVGGTCVARGCMPKKFLVIASKKAMDAGSSGPRGLETKIENISWQDVIEHEQAVVSDLIDINRDGLVDYERIELLEGTAKLDGNGTVEVDGRSVSYNHLVLATGLRPAPPPVEGAKLGQTSDEFLRDGTQPDSMVVVGGGYIGVEFSSVLQAFGTDVTILHRPDQLVKQHDRDVADALGQQLRERGIEISLESEVQRIEEAEENYRVTYAQKGEEHVTRADKVLLATGRRPNVEELGLKAAGVELDNSGHIKVDEYYQTTAKNIYSVGDVIGHHQFTPVAIVEGKTAALNALENRADTVDYDSIPSAVFTHPEIGSAGLVESEARNRFDNVEVATSSFTPFTATVKGHDEETFIKVIYAGSSRKLVGLHVCGPSASEMVQGFSLAMKKGATQEDFRDFPGIHPTVAEEIFSAKPS